MPNPKGNAASIHKAALASAAKRRLPYPYPRKFKDLYRNMMDRCYNQTNKRWANYGGRGIYVCPSWYFYRRVFYEWAHTHGYRPGLQLDRKNVNKGYSESNCRFVDAFVQQNNTTRNHRVTWQNRTQTISEWAREIGVRPQALIHRFTRKWDLQRAMTQPFGRTIRVRA